jgi:hypothetical protein
MLCYFCKQWRFVFPSKQRFLRLDTAARTHTYTMEIIILLMHRPLDFAYYARTPVLDDTNIESLLAPFESWFTSFLR